MKSKLFIPLICSFLLFSISASAQIYRSFDGSQNNLNNPFWGAANTQLTRIVHPDYADGISVPKLDLTYDRPNPRVISNRLFAQTTTISNGLALSDFIWAFGQFIDHDISLVENDPDEILSNIEIPSEDLFFTPGSTMHMSRSMAAPGTGTDINNPRQHTNQINSFIDASTVYGSDEDRANWLRTFDGGKLKTSPGNLLPWNTVTGNINDEIDFNAPFMADDTRSLTRYFVAGDIRANENPLLLSFHVVFLREHNRLCEELGLAHPSWNDERIYQRARKLVGALIQEIVYNEWLPAMGVELPNYFGYNATINPSVSNEFSAAAFRLGHTLINSNIIRMNNDGSDISGGNISLRDAFFNPFVMVLSGGVDTFLKGMATQVQQEMDCKVIDDVRNFLFGAPGQGGLDLAAININRGRERGIPSFNQIRQHLGLPSVNSFYTLTNDQEVADILQEVYGSIDNLDPWVGMVSEQHVGSDALFGELIMTILEEQFQVLRDGDRYYYEVDNELTAAQKEMVSNTTMKDVIVRNTSIDLMQDQVFIAMPHEMISDGPVIKQFDLEAQLYPNPTSGNETTIKYFSDIDQNINLDVIDYQGRLITSVVLFAYAGDNYFQMVLPANMPRGLYNIRLQTQYGYNILKLIKE